MTMGFVRVHDEALARRLGSNPLPLVYSAGETRLYNAFLSVRWPIVRADAPSEEPNVNTPRSRRNANP